ESHHSSWMCESTPRYRTCWVGTGTAGCRVERVSPHTCAEVRERRAGARGEIFDVPAGRVPPELVDVPIGADVIDVLGALPGEDVGERLPRGRRRTGLLRRRLVMPAGPVPPQSVDRGGVVVGTAVDDVLRALLVEGITERLGHSRRAASVGAQVEVVPAAVRSGQLVHVSFESPV